MSDYGDINNKRIVNTKTSVFRRIGARRLQDSRLREAFSDDNTLIEMLAGMMTESEFLELSSVLKYYKEMSDKNDEEEEKV